MQTADSIESPEVAIEDARRLIEARDRSGAHDALASARARFPSEARLCWLAAELCLEEGRPAAALETLASFALDDADLSRNLETVYRAVKLKTAMATPRQAVRFAPPRPAPPFADAIVVMMARDEGDIIHAHLEHHYALGFRKFVILANLCADDTLDEIARFERARADAILLVVKDPVEAYYQSGKTKSAVDFARSYFQGIREPARWAFILDADEFMDFTTDCGLEGLVGEAEAASQHVIALRLCDAANKEKREAARGCDLYAHFDAIAAGTMRVRLKNAFALRLDPILSTGNHVLWHNDMAINRVAIAMERGVRLIHMPYRSCQQVRRKIVNGAKALAAATHGGHVGGHWREAHADYLAKGDVFLNEAFEHYCKNTIYRASREYTFKF